MFGFHNLLNELHHALFLFGSDWICFIRKKKFHHALFQFESDWICFIWKMNEGTQLRMEDSLQLIFIGFMLLSILNPNTSLLTPQFCTTLLTPQFCTTLLSFLAVELSFFSYSYRVVYILVNYPQNCKILNK